MNPKTINVDIYSDIACPWCYVGEKKFFQAKRQYLEANPSHQIKVSWHPYMIDPNTKKNGEDYLAYNKRRWGGDGWTYSLKEAGKKVGCFFANWKTWPNTFLGHCLVTYAAKFNKADEVLEEIFTYSYEQGENVSDIKVLDKIAEKFKLDEGWKQKEVQNAVLEADAYAKEEMDIHGVPYFIINNKYPLEGAVGSELFLKYFNK